MSKYKQTPWIDKCINEYRGTGIDQATYVSTMTVAELVALTKAEYQLQAEQQAHNALKEKLKTIEWVEFDSKYYCPICKQVFS